MITFSVSEEKNRWLRARMAALGIREEELEEKFVRSAGKGGQHVNKSSSCVWLKHIPTGIEVKCMEDRSQSLNRFLARREIVEKIALLMGQSTHLSIKKEKERRQKERRRRRSASKYRNSGKDEEGDM
jgi:peptide chain release factor